MSITLKDVALAAGVSPATASLALNNKSGVSENTRNTVIEMAKRLNYSFHSSASKTKPKQPICFIKIAVTGLIVNEDHKGFISDYIEGIEKEARISGFSLEVRNYDTFDSQVIITDIYKRAYSGVVILATELLEKDILAFKTMNVPKIFIDSSFPFHSIDFVNMDNQSALFTVVKRFIDSGKRKLGIIRSNVITRNFELRHKYFYEALNYFGLKIDSKWDITVGPSFDESYNDMMQILNSSENLPEGFFCVSDIIGIGAMRALKENNIKIPEDIAIIGFDDLPQCQMVDPALSSVKVPKELMGKRAFQYLEKMMNYEERVASEKTYIGCEVVLRGSF